MRIGPVDKDLLIEDGFNFDVQIQLEFCISNKKLKDVMNIFFGEHYTSTNHLENILELNPKVISLSSPVI